MIDQIAVAVIVGQGAVSGIIAYIMYRKKSAKLALCHRTWGEVIEVKEHRGSEGATKHPVIRYRAMNGQDLTFESKFGTSNWKVKTGDRLEILVNRKDPTDAEVVGFMVQWLLPLIFALASIGSLITAAVMYLFFRR